MLLSTNLIANLMELCTKAEATIADEVTCVSTSVNFGQMELFNINNIININTKKQTIKILFHLFNRRSLKSSDIVILQLLLNYLTRPNVRAHFFRFSFCCCCSCLDITFTCFKLM